MHKKRKPCLHNCNKFVCIQSHISQGMSVCLSVCVYLYHLNWFCHILQCTLWFSRLYAWDYASLCQPKFLSIRIISVLLSIDTICHCVQCRSWISAFSSWDFNTTYYYLYSLQNLFSIKWSKVSKHIHLCGFFYLPLHFPQVN